ncbi:MAG TPA: DNA translocase FtsK 4TM domain-containing protein [Flavobacterium alvei]|nr:DNA translocase FtsK 4TM domain-containing protein [Flavobacterium alvei]
MSKKKSKKNKKETIKEKKKYLNINDETKRGVIVVLLFALAIIFVLSFESAGGVLGKYLLTASRFLFGKCLWLMPLAFIAGGIAILKEIHKNVYLSTLLGLFLFLLCFLAIVETFSAVDIKNSGWFGYLFSWPFLNFIGKWASLVVFVAGLLVSVLVAFNIPLKKVKKEEEASEKEEIAVEKLSKEIKGIGFDQSEKRVANLVKGIFSKTKIDVKKQSKLLLILKAVFYSFKSGFYKIINKDLSKLKSQLKLIYFTLVKNYSPPLNFNMYNYYYYLNFQKKNDLWAGVQCFQTKWLNIFTANELREFRKSPIRSVNNSGWHFSYLGGKEMIKYKIKNFSHQEYNVPEIVSDEYIDFCINNGYSLFEYYKNPNIKPKYIKKEISHLPQNLHNIVVSYKKLIF